LVQQTNLLEVMEARLQLEPGLARLAALRATSSPYKAGSIIDFWARWHMTLTRYLTAYLYYPVAMAISRAREKRGLSVARPQRARRAALRPPSSCPRCSPWAWPASGMAQACST
jgi:hypothetical protein